MTRPSGRLLSNYFVSGAGTSVQDLIFTVTGKPCFTGKHFSLRDGQGAAGNQHAVSAIRRMGEWPCNGTCAAMYLAPESKADIEHHW